MSSVFDLHICPFEFSYLYFILLGEAGGCKRIHPVPAEGSHSDKPNLTQPAAHTHTFHLLN